MCYFMTQDLYDFYGFVPSYWERESIRWCYYVWIGVLVTGTGYMIYS